MSDDDDVEEEYYSTLGDGQYRTYLQKNRRCFNVYRDGNGLHLAPLVSVEMEIKSYC